MQEIIDFVEYYSNQQFEGEEGSKELEFATRCNGDVGAEEYSQFDLDDANQVALRVFDKFKDLVDTYSVDTCDEWVSLIITLK